MKRKPGARKKYTEKRRDGDRKEDLLASYQEATGQDKKAEIKIL